MAETRRSPDVAADPVGAAGNPEFAAWLAAYEAERAAEKAAAAEEVRRLDETIATLTDPADLADAYADRGSAHGRTGDSERALGDYAKALELATDAKQIRCLKLSTALELLSDGQRRLSFSWAIDAVNDDVDDAGSWDVLGLIAGHCEFFAFATEALRRALALQPDRASAMLNLGKYLLEAGDLRGAAAEVLARYVAANPRDAHGWHLLGWATQMTLRRADRRERALECYRRALAENPDYLMRQRIERSIRDIEDAEGGNS